MILTIIFSREKTFPSIAEEVISFDRELSVIIVRDKDGNIKTFEPGENVHKKGILVTTTLPSSTSEVLKNDAVTIARKIVANLDYIGVMGVEFFLKENELYVNEIAPRVHNSGHWTMDGSYSSPVPATHQSNYGLASAINREAFRHYNV